MVVVTALEKAREYVIEQAKLLVRQKASMDDVAIAVDRLEALEINPEAIEQPIGIPFRVVRNGVPVTKCIVKFNNGIRIGVWIRFGWTTRAIDAAKIEYKKLYDVDETPSIVDIIKPMQYTADKGDFVKQAINVPYTANDGTSEQFHYIVDNRHKQ